MSIVSKASRPYVPPFPRRPEKPRGALSIIFALRRNPIEIWCEADFERPVSIGRSILGLRGAAHDPAAVRRILLDNAANYRKDDLQLRMLRPGLGNGLLTADGEDWRVQRRALAPLFSPRQVGEFAPAMQRVGRAAVERMSRRRDGAVDGGQRDDVAHDARGARADAVFAGAGARAERIPAGGDQLFRHHRQARPPRSRGRAQLPAPVRTPSRPSGPDVLRSGGRRHY